GRAGRRGGRDRVRRAASPAGRPAADPRRAGGAAHGARPLAPQAARAPGGGGGLPPHGEREDRQAHAARAVARRGSSRALVSVADETVARHGRLDVLVNNAALSKHKQFFHMSADEAELVMRVNFLSCVWTTMAAIPHMLRQGRGTIVNVSSFAAKVAPPREAMYAASKAAMNAFSEGLWNDLAGSNIHVGSVNPGPIDTEIWFKEDEPVWYDGKKYRPEVVTDAIFEAIEKRRYEMTVPKRNPMLLVARFLRLFVPSLLRFGMAKTDPVPAEVV